MIREKHEMYTYTLVSNRFTDATWRANEEYRKKNGIEGCIYGSPQRLCTRIDMNSLMYVIEMNNSQNKIIGIGIIRNKIQTDKYYSIYETGNYNRYIFKGNYHLNREELPKQLIDGLEHILFKNKTHMKRGSGMTIVPEKLLRNEKFGEMDVKEEIRKVFLAKYKNNQEDSETIVEEQLCPQISQKL
jgi:hypothetical protein